MKGTGSIPVELWKQCHVNKENLPSIPYSSLLVRDRVDDENLRPESNPVADKQRRIRINRRMAETFKRAGG
ncbi:MAG TPA: hypothetical protein VL485_30475, partial [Ktedonobacteraceae bacterium]|nr:hypothetical protein [Ktedonobacteraceae bacterium]